MVLSANSCLQLQSHLIKLSVQWRSYLENHQITELAINIFYWTSLLMCCATQTIFHQHKGRVISLGNECNNLRKYLERKRFIPNGSFKMDEKLQLVFVAGFFGPTMVTTLLFTVYFVGHKREPRHLSSFLLASFYDSQNLAIESLATAAGFLFEFWFWAARMGTIIVQIYINLHCLRTVSTTMKCLKRWV